MKQNFAVSTPLQYFEMLVRRDEPRLLIEAAISLGQDAEPHLDVQAALYQFERMQKLLRDCVPWGANALQRLVILNQFFYEDLAYSCNINDFHHPENNYLHKVMEKRRGSPVALGMLWLELAYGIGLTAHGVLFPGTFLVKVHVPEGVVLQNPATGEALTPEQLQEDAQVLQDAWARVEPEEDMPPLELYLQPATSRELVGLMLRELQSMHQQQGDEAMERAVRNRRAVMATVEALPAASRDVLSKPCQKGQAAR